MQKITPFLWFNDQAEEAVKFYVSVFKDSKMGNMARYDEAGANASGRPAWSVMTADFEIEGQQFIALNGGPQFQFTPAISFVINCETQEEVDYYWDALSDGGRQDVCGWLQDKFGISWQVVPTALGRLMGDPDPAKSQRVMAAMLKMKKLDIRWLEEAYRG